MIYLFHGSDASKIRSKAFAWVQASKTKAPDATYIRLDASALSSEVLEELTSTQGLFFKKTLVLLDDPFSIASSAELVLENLDILKESPNPIAILAPKLIAARVKKIEAKAEKVFVENTAEKAKRGFNTGLVNALASRDPKSLWKEITFAFRSGDAPEAVHGLLHWKARDLMQKGGRGWSEEEARKLSRDLILLLRESRSGDLELAPALERFALSLR